MMLMATVPRGGLLGLAVAVVWLGVAFGPPPARAAKLLFVSGLGGPGSHFYVGSLLAEELTERGHSVTFLISDAFGHRANSSLAERFGFEVFPSTFSRSNVREGLRQLGSSSLAGHQASTWHWISLWMLSKPVMSMGVNAFFASECDATLSDAGLAERLRAADFDLVVGDVLYPCFVLVAQRLGLPYVNVLNGIIMPMEHGRPAGLPSSPAFLPSALTRYADDMSLVQRCLNVAAYAATAFLYDQFSLRSFDRLKAKHAIRPELATFESLGRSELWLVNIDFVADFVRGLTPNVVLVGGITASPPKPLDEDLASFVEGSGEHGVVVFTLSSYYNELQGDMSSRLASALARLPQRVLWKYEGAPPTGLGNNTRLVKWLPINDILGHPKTRVLITQCGINSVMEAVYHGVPMVGMPLTGDQFHVLVRLLPKGFVKKVDVVTVTEEMFYRTIVDVLEDKSYRESALKWSRIFRDKPVPPRELAANWIELVLNYGGAHLRPRSLGLNFFQLNSIDVLLVLALLAAALAAVTYYVVKVTCRSLCRRRVEKVKAE